MSRETVVKFVCPDCMRRKLQFKPERRQTPKGTAPRPYQVLGGLLKMRRTTLGLTAKEVAKRVGIMDACSIASWERGTGRPLPKKYPLIAEVLGITVFQMKLAADVDEARAERAKA